MLERSLGREPVGESVGSTGLPCERGPGPGGARKTQSAAAIRSQSCSVFTASDRSKPRVRVLHDRFDGRPARRQSREQLHVRSLKLIDHDLMRKQRASSLTTSAARQTRGCVNSPGKRLRVPRFNEDAARAYDLPTGTDVKTRYGRAAGECFSQGEPKGFVPNAAEDAAFRVAQQLSRFEAGEVPHVADRRAVELRLDVLREVSFVGAGAGNDEVFACAPSGVDGIVYTFLGYEPTDKADRPGHGPRRVAPTVKVDAVVDHLAVRQMFLPLSAGKVRHGCVARLVEGLGLRVRLYELLEGRSVQAGNHRRTELTGKERRHVVEAVVVDHVVTALPDVVADVRVGVVQLGAMTRLLTDDVAYVERFGCDRMHAETWTTFWTSIQDDVMPSILQCSCEVKGVSFKSPSKGFTDWESEVANDGDAHTENLSTAVANGGLQGSPRMAELRLNVVCRMLG